MNVVDMYFLLGCLYSVKRCLQSPASEKHIKNFAYVSIPLKKVIAVECQILAVANCSRVSPPPFDYL